MSYSSSSPLNPRTTDRLGRELSRAPKLTVTTDVKFDRALTDGEMELLYAEMTECYGDESYDEQWTALHGGIAGAGAWAITGVRLTCDFELVAQGIEALREWSQGGGW